MHLHALDDLRHQVQSGDVDTFDQRTADIRQQILSAIRDYGMVTASLQVSYSVSVCVCVCVWERERVLYVESAL